MIKITALAAASSLAIVLATALPAQSQEQFTMNGAAVSAEQVQVYQDHCDALLTTAAADGGGDAGVGAGGNPPVEANAMAAAGQNAAETPAAGQSTPVAENPGNPPASAESAMAGETVDLSEIDILDCVEGGFIEEDAAAAAGVEGINEAGAAGGGAIKPAQ